MNNLNNINDNTVKKLLFNHNLFTDDLHKALNIVEEFIINKKLILVGGMSIDMALKLKGDKIYEDDDVPDYDFFSPNFHKDAYDLVELLYENLGDNSINVINAMHISTMRVRIHFTTVADITYIPLDIYNKLPTINYETKKGIFKIIHPYFQMINQHRSLYMPFENAPNETIFYRWKKDIKRFDLLEKYYSLENEGIEPIELKNTDNKIIINKTALEGCCIGGISALLFWINMAKKMDCNIRFELGGCKFENDTIEFNMPIYHNMVTIFNNDIYSIRKRFEEVRTIDEYYPCLDMINSKLIVNDKYELIDNKDQLISSYLYQDIYIVNIQQCLLYNLYHYIFDTNEDKNIKSFYKIAYIIGLDILRWAIDNYIKINNIDEKSKYRPFLPSIETFGNKNESINMKIFMVRFDKLLGIKNDYSEVKLPSKFFIEENSIHVPEEYYKYEPSSEYIYKLNCEKIKSVEEVL